MYASPEIYLSEQSQSFNDFISSFYKQLNSKKLFFIPFRLIKAQIISYTERKERRGKFTVISQCEFFQILCSNRVLNYN